ncbi:hypothetical protein [Gordonia caeni]|uniref:Aerobactin siderophore biosynthesis IucA/IucC-like C-terminal domain-containing protein n=1 Tax=Gordonia caeni TaxID=1007097 RepID=A0ABP7NXR6_9ACTN
MTESLPESLRALRKSIPAVRVECAADPADAQRLLHDGTDIEGEVTGFRAADLVDGSAAGELIELHARHRGMPVGRHAASLVFQRYSHRLCGAGALAWVEYGWVPDLTADNVGVRFVDGSPHTVVLSRPRLAGTTAEDLVRIVVDEHLLPVARAMRKAGGPGLPNLLGNVAAGFAGAFRTMSRDRPAHLVAERAESVLGVDPRLERGGSFRTLLGPLGERLQYDRASCCHWYAAPDGKYCSWCSRLSHDERTARFCANMADEAGAVSSARAR